MVTRLDKELRREIDIDGAAYVVRISAHGMSIAQKGRRKGIELRWKDLVSGDAALATALNASLSGRVLERR